MSKIPKEQIELGTKIEEEHKNTIEQVKKNPKMETKEVEKNIALDHLRENPNYYVKDPNIKKEELRLPTSYLSKARMIVAEFKLKVLRRMANEDLNEMKKFFYNWDYETIYFLNKAYGNLINNPAEYINSIQNPQNWNFLTGLFKDKSIAPLMAKILQRSYITPSDFIELFKNNNYDFLETMADVHTKFSKILDIKKELEREQIKKFYPLKKKLSYLLKKLKIIK